MYRGIRRARQRIFGIILLALGAITGEMAQARPLILEHLSTLEGLPQGTVMATLQDSQGFVWLGTEDGLVRFDGHDVYRYAYSRTTKDGLPGNFVTADRRGQQRRSVDCGQGRWPCTLGPRHRQIHRLPARPGERRFSLE